MNLFITAIHSRVESKSSFRVCVTDRPLEDIDLPQLLNIPFVVVKAKSKRAAEKEVSSRLMDIVADEIDTWKVTKNHKEVRKPCNCRKS